MEDFEKQTAEIMEWFNWGRVQKTMVFLDWRWGDNPKSPTIAELKKQAEMLLIRVADNKENVTLTECGGFRATKRITSEGQFLELSFILDSWNTDK